MAGRRPESWWARHACDALGLEGRLRKVADGIDTTFMLIGTTDDRCAVRVGALPIRTREALQAECDWIERLQHHDALRVPDVYSDPSGATTVEVQDGKKTRPAMAVSWLPGRKMRWRFTLSHAARLGAAAAALHQDASTHPVPSGVKDWTGRICGVGDLDELATIAGEDAIDTVSAMQAAVAAACRELDQADASGLIIGDLDLTTRTGSLTIRDRVSSTSTTLVGVHSRSTWPEPCTVSDGETTEKRSSQQL